MITVLMGKSGSGKNTVADTLCRRNGYKRILTYTSRPPRPGETEEDYHFVSDDVFNKMTGRGEFAEYKAYHPAQGGTWQYGSKITEDQIKSDEHYLLILTPAGFRDIKKSLPDADIHSVYLYCTTKTLEKRLLKRGDDHREAIRRLSADEKDFAWTQNLAYKTIICDTKTPREIVADIRAAESRFFRQAVRDEKAADREDHER